MKNILAAITCLWFALCGTAFAQGKSEILFLPPASVPTSGVSFNSPSIWIELASLGQAYSAGTTQIDVIDATPICRQAFVRFFPRATPVTGTVQMRLTSYYYDQNGYRVYDHTWPVVSSSPGYLGNVGAWVQDKLNALAVASENNPVGRQHNVLIEVIGVGTMFGARLEMQ